MSGKPFNAGKALIGGGLTVAFGYLIMKSQSRKGKESEMDESLASPLSSSTDFVLSLLSSCTATTPSDEDFYKVSRLD